VQAVELLARCHGDVDPGVGVPDDRVERAGNVTRFRARRSLLERTKVVLARELLVLLTGEWECSITAILAAVRALVPKEKRNVSLLIINMAWVGNGCGSKSGRGDDKGEFDIVESEYFLTKEKT
jgi:hypothetical protein